MNREMLYDLIYALAAVDGREQALFGTCAPLAHAAFRHSLAGTGFPELWFELPLAGEPWFDVHVLTAREDLDPQAPPEAAICGGVPEAFAWFASQGPEARQLALSWDIGSGSLASPAIQLLKRVDDSQLTCSFLAAAGRQDAVAAYRAFEARLPEGWFACYTGVFPQRTSPFLRVECIPAPRLQQAYAADPALLGGHLRQVGLRELGDTLLPRCQALADTPFQLEFQFDVMPDGTAGPTMAASVRFDSPPGSEKWGAFDVDGPAGALMGKVEAWGLADGRWRLLHQTTYAKRATLAGQSSMLWCFPAFLKLRWRDGAPLDAKAYLMAGATLGDGADA